MPGGCKKIVKPKTSGFQINTSDVVKYDGAAFSCVSIPSGASLNQVLEALEAHVCSITPPTSASGITYDGTTSFSCFTITGGDVAAAISEVATELCSLSSTVSSLSFDTGDILLDTGSLTLDCYSGEGWTTSTPLNALLDKLIEDTCNNNTVAGAAAPLSLLEIYFDEWFDNDYVEVGGVFAPSGLGGTIDDGSGGASTYYTDGIRAVVASSPITLTATSDNYVDVDTSGSYVVTAVSIAAPAPPITGQRLYKIETDGVGVVTTTDLRQIYSMIPATLFTEKQIDPP